MVDFNTSPSFFPQLEVSLIYALVNKAKGTAPLTIPLTNKIYIYCLFILNFFDMCFPIKEIITILKNRPKINITTTTAEKI